MSVAIESPWSSNDSLLKIDWYVQSQCNYDCSYCPSNQQKMSFLDYNLACSAIDRLVSLRPNIRITFTGGEPCLHPSILDLVSYSSSRGIELSLVSNGSRNLNFYSSLLEHLNSITFSYHHEFVKSNFVKLVSSLTHHHPNKKVNVHVMMLPGYFKEIKAVIEELSNNGVSFVLRRIRPMVDEEGGLVPPFAGRGVFRKEIISPPPYYTNEEIEYIQSINSQVYCNVLVHYEDSVKESNVNEILSEESNCYKGWLCHAGIQSLMILPNGDIWSSVCRSKFLGNLNDQFVLPTEPLLCPKSYCTCASDLNTTKYKLGYQDKVRLK